MSFIFLEQSLYSRSPCPGNRCKVVFSSPKHSLTPREVQATVKNCFTIRVRVPHCPSKFLLLVIRHVFNVIVSCVHITCKSPQSLIKGLTDFSADQKRSTGI